MGDPKKLRKRYQTPVHPWNKKNIDEEKILMKEYGLGKKKEIMISDSFLKKYMNIAKKLIASQSEQGEKVKAQILQKLTNLGILTASADLDHILGLEVKDVLERRLQSVVFRKGLARSMKQARQFIVHRHILIGDKEITAPSYLITLEEESKLDFKEKSSLFDENHPERAVPEPAVEEKPVEKKEDSESPAKEAEKVEEKTKTPAEETKEEVAEEKPVEDKVEEPVKEEKAEEAPADTKEESTESPEVKKEETKE
jgi:small subunit ribosomal protein S4